MMQKDLKNFVSLETDLQGWVREQSVFDEMIKKTMPKIIIEVGSWKGASTILMAKKCKELGLDTKIYCVDTWLGALEFYTKPTPERDLMKKHGYPQVYYQFLSNIVNEGVADMIEVVPLPSNIAYKLLPKADLVYIDGSHEYKDVVDDIKNYIGLLNAGGVMFGDDYENSAFPGVKEAVQDSLYAYSLEVLAGWYWSIKI